MSEREVGWCVCGDLLYCFPFKYILIQNKVKQDKAKILCKVFSHVYSGLSLLSFDATNIISLSAINELKHSLRLNQVKLPIFHIGLGSVLTYKNIYCFI